jgi:hypothetical protein
MEDWCNTVVWSWHNMELTNGKLVIIIPLGVLLLLCLIAIIKCLFVSPKTHELLVYYKFLGALDKVYRQGKMDKETYKCLREIYALNNLLIPSWMWVWCPWKWTTKQMFVRGRYELLINLTTVLQDS